MFPAILFLSYTYM